MTGTPRAMILPMAATCVDGGVIRSTRSGRVSSSATSRSPKNRPMPKRAASACAFVVSRLTMATHSTSGMLRQPRYWNWLK